ncbi:hypothetical protein VTI74DRAFT_11195 [Chaetomium olivicolor]
MARIRFALVLLAVLAALASASLPSFCKCTCFQNSTIIPLGPHHDSPPPPPPPPPKQSTSTFLSSPASTPSSPTITQDTTTTSPKTDRRSFPYHWLSPRESSTSCAQCNRAFCLKYNLPICKGAEAKDIKTDCFQRDSHKDRVIVWGFILGTAGLLGWAAVRRVMERAGERERQRQGGGFGHGNRGGGLGGSGGGGQQGAFGLGLGGGGLGGRDNSGRGSRNGTGSGDGGLLRRGSGAVVYDPLEDGHDEGVTRGPG